MERSKETYVGVDREIAQQFFAEGGTLYFQPKGYNLGILEPFNNQNCKSLKHALAIWIADGRGANPEICIRDDDPHPKCPVKRIAPNHWVIESPETPTEGG